MTTLSTDQAIRTAMSAPAAHGKRIWTAALWILWVACLVLGAIGMYQRIAHGHLPAGYGSYVP